MSTLPLPTCPSCAGSAPHRIGVLPDAGVFAGRDASGTLPVSSLYRCPGCGLLFRHPVLSADQYAELYGKAASTCWSDESGRSDWALIEDYLARTVTAGARVLDFGCHTGGLLKRLDTRYETTGVEVNALAARIARQESGAAVVDGLGSLPGDAKFDAVLAADVIEHFPDPGRQLATLIDVLVPGGMLVVTTGNADAFLWRIAGARWWYCYFPEHLAFISERWMRDWLRRSGSGAHLVQAIAFRHRRLSPLRRVVESGLLLAYLAAPGLYARLVGRLRRVFGRGATVYPPGSGLTRDHVLLALRKTG